MTTMSTTTLSAGWTPESVPPSTDTLLRLRHLEARVQLLELAVRNLADLLDRADDRMATDMIREVLDEFHP